MKKLYLSVFFLVLLLEAFSQTPCLPVTNGYPAGDLPPGCTVCDTNYEGTTAGFTPDSFSVDFPCGTVENSQWLSFYADSVGILSITILTADCLLNQGVEFALFDSNLNRVSDCVASGGTGLPPNITVDGLTPGNLFFLLIDGVNGDECLFQLSQSGAIGSGYPHAPVRIRAEPEASRYCLLAEVCFSIDPIPGAIEYLWEVPANLDSLSGGGLLDTFFCVKFNNYGGGVFSVTPAFDCGPGTPSITPAVAIPILPTYTAMTVCEDDLPIKYANQSFDEFGTHSFDLKTELGCDSPIVFTMLKMDIPVETVDTLICAGTCVQIQDSCYWVSTTGLDLHCRFIGELNIETIDSFPAPALNCRVNPGNSFFYWDEVPGASGYLIIINGDTLGIQTRTDYPIFALPVDSQITFRVQPVADNNCIFKAAEISCPESSFTRDFIENQIRIFPNPTFGEVFIESKMEIEEIEIFDISGKSLGRFFQRKFDLKGFPFGIYFLKIKTDKGIALKKLNIRTE